MCIGGFVMVHVAAYVTIFMVRNYDPTTRYNDLLDHALRHRNSIISHSHTTTSTNLTWGGGDLVVVGCKVALLLIPLGTIDFLVHHIHAFTIHVSYVWGSVSDQRY
ncbi:hypothetical protein H5410_041738 [Solanum commersonii]|uniref:Uncharacterized protein n=1 Tax=Solanum commersonii TaxID=4109 RepID=A0A9J5XVK6_SOLCO|nr:hypothetical protein H5410_041738 [Solanum commersonii]